jgi:uncharacterized membrane protein
MENRQTINEKLLWIPLIALASGIGIPRIFIDLAESGWQDRLYWGILSAMIMFIYVIFKKLGIKYPKLLMRSNNSIAGMTAVIFFGSLMVSGLSILFAILPLPGWLHISLAIVLSLFALSLMVSETSHGS